MDTIKAFSTRRDLLKQAASLPLIAAVQSRSASTASLPQMKLGKYSLSRLICGSNCFNAGSHLFFFFDQELKKYYRPERTRKDWAEPILRTLRRCREVGINCWQSGGTTVEYQRLLVAEGCDMRYLSIESIETGDPSSILPELARSGCIGVAHHGEHTDRFFKDGKFNQVHDYLKRIRDAGLLVGVSTHMPAVLDEIESKDWDVDYFMTCVYERNRTEAELEKLLGQLPVSVGNVFLQNDPPRMFKMIRQTKRPCLAFKILAAGRFSDKPELVERAFRDAYANIKPGDGIIVGMYDRFSDQPAQNAEFTRRFGSV